MTMIINPFAFGGGSGPVTDPYWANVAALLHFDGPNGSSTFTDEKGNTWTATGSPLLTTSVSKYGGASIDLTGASAKYIRKTNVSNQFDLTGDFTIEAWCNPTDLTAFCEFIVIGDTAPNIVIIRTTNAGVWQVTVNGTIRITGTTATASTFSHVALSRNSGSWRLFVNGTQVGSTYSDSTSYPPTFAQVGGNSFRTRGYVDDFRFTKGVGRYTGTFTPPAAAFPNS